MIGDVEKEDLVGFEYSICMVSGRHNDHKRKIMMLIEIDSMCVEYINYEVRWHDEIGEPQSVSCDSLPHAMRIYNQLGVTVS